MNKYRATFIFYAIAVTIIYVLCKISPDAHDDGPGFGSLGIMLMAVVITGHIIFNMN